MDVLTFETCRAVNSEIIKQVTSVGLSLLNYKTVCLPRKTLLIRKLTMFYRIQLVCLYTVDFEIRQLVRG
jgi:hypothetical protein